MNKQKMSKFKISLLLLILVNFVNLQTISIDTDYDIEMTFDRDDNYYGNNPPESNEDQNENSEVDGKVKFNKIWLIVIILQFKQAISASYLRIQIYKFYPKIRGRI